MGDILRKKKQVQQAIKHYDRALIYQGNNQGALFGKAFALDDAGQKFEAIQVYNRLIVINKGHWIVYVNKGFIEFQLGLFEQSEINNLKQLEINMRSVHSIANLSFIDYSKGNYEKGLKLCESALEIDPKFDEIYYNLSLILWAQNDREGAYANICKALELNKENFWYFYQRLYINFEQQNYQKMLDDLASVAKIVRDLSDSTAIQFREVI